MKRPCSTACSAASGFTLVETVAALLILAMLIGIVTLRADRLTPAWRLRSAAFDVENTLRFAQNAAASRGCTAQVLYDVPEGSFWVRIEGDDSSYSYGSLPKGVRFESVRFATGTEIRNDVAAVSARDNGTVDPHQVSLVGSSGGRIVLRVSRLTGEVDYTETQDAPTP